MIVLGDAIHVIIVHAEPPGVPAHQGHIDLLQEVEVGIGLVEFEGRPGQDGRLSDLGSNGMTDLGDDTLIVDRVGQHAIV